MRTGWQTINKILYYFNSSGYLPNAVVFKKTSVSVRELKTVQLYASAPYKGTKGVKWSSSNTSLATVDSTGKVTAKKAGTVTITAKSASGSKSATCKVKVIPYIKASAISVSPATLSLYAAATKELSYSLTTPEGAPIAANDTVTWSSSDKSIAKVSSSGTVTGIKYGKVTITAKTEGGKSDSAQVTVRSIKASQTTAQLTQGTRMYATFKTYGSPKPTIKYKSSDTAIATVNATSGLVTASQTKTGTATITATASDGDKTTTTIKVVNYPTIIDVSKWQGTIDWSKASKVVDLAILRVAYGADTNYELKYPTYSKDCKTYDVPFGVYSYGLYKTKAQAEKEATVFYNAATADGRKPAFFVVDCEESYITRANTEAYIAKLRKLAGKRVKVGVYVAHNLYKKMNLNLTTDTSKSKTPDFVWIPRYSLTNNGSITGVTVPDYKCEMWQYSSGGYIPGIKGKVDMNTLVKADGATLSATKTWQTWLTWLQTPA